MNTPHNDWHYGLMGFPLAFVALPLYVLLPHFYASSYGVPLASLGAVLLGTRLCDAVIDPVLGRWSDRLFARAPASVLAWAGLVACLLGLGFALLFFPPFAALDALLAWVSACLLLTYAAFSALSLLHQSWGARLGGNELQRARVVAWREGLGLLGVVTASLAPLLLGLPATTALLFVALALAWWAWSGARRPLGAAPAQPATSIWLPFASPAFRTLLAVFVLNGIASAVPATLLLFFVQDRLQATPAMQPLFLGSYFLCAALSMPLWLRLVKRIGLARCWAVGMLLAVLVFGFAAQLGAGDAMPFLLVCALSGLALGTDLALPAALLAGTIGAAGDQNRAEGAYFGWWNFASKLNLALAAGVALPALAWLGYTPGTQDAAALQTLNALYCLLPCALKLMALALLYTHVIRKSPWPNLA
jgi:glycoside/pentoside/hexuronide:cation symporter, GPH family